MSEINIKKLGEQFSSIISRVALHSIGLNKQALLFEDKLRHIQAYTNATESELETITEHIEQIVRDTCDFDAGVEEMDHIKNMCARYGYNYLRRILGYIP